MTVKCSFVALIYACSSGDPPARIVPSIHPYVIVLPIPFTLTPLTHRTTITIVVSCVSSSRTLPPFTAIATTATIANVAANAPAAHLPLITAALH